jgi:hypothetical protein
VQLRAVHPVKPIYESIFYFEITLVGLGGNTGVTIGLVDARSPKSLQIGMAMRTYGLRVDGISFQYGDSSKREETSMIEGDVVGCGIDLFERSVFFTKNGEILPHEFEEVESCEFFPAVSLSS